MSIENRFKKYMKKSNTTDCIEWQGYLNKDGYGRFRIGDKKIGAHRVAYELYKNSKIPSNMEVDHICFNRSCVNIEHLQLLTPTQNKKRRKTKEPKSTCKKGHEMSIENTIKRKDGSIKCRKCDNIRQKIWIRNKRNLEKSK